MIASTGLLESCSDGVRPPAPATAVVNISASMSRYRGGRQVFDRADRLFVRFLAGQDVRTEQELPFTPSGAESIVRLEVPLREPTEELRAELELRVGSHALFRSATTAMLSADTATAVDFALEPVVAAVGCGTGVVQLGAYGQTAQLTGAALFATGDTVRDVPITWSVAATNAVSVSAVGLVTALQDGDAIATCAASGANATRAVRVFAIVNSVRVAPSAATLVAGSTLPIVATLFDARSNPITTTRPLAWSSANVGVATVNAAGVVTAVSAGSARIDATSGGVAASAVISVVVPPAVTTIGLDTGEVYTVAGLVTPNGNATNAWFEYGTSASLAGSVRTAQQPIGSGSNAVRVVQLLSGLQQSTTYYVRAAASNIGGTTLGAITSFRTGGPPTVGALTTSIPPSSCQTVVASTSATPNGVPTLGWIEYGASATLASFNATTFRSLGNGTTPVPFAAALFGYQTIYFRAAAANQFGTVRSAIQSIDVATCP